MKRIHSTTMRLIWLILTGLPLGSLPLQAEPIKVLIVDGYSNHDWQRTTKLIRGVLEPTKLFTVSVATAPVHTNAAPWESWCPVFGDYDVVIQNCNNMGASESWPGPAQEAFERFVREGGGVFIFHSANNAFPNWEAYNRIIGLGWRPKNYGTAITIDSDDSLRRIPPGEGEKTTHGPRSDRVIHRLGEHPIHNGLPRCWMTPMIEVYTHARGPAENLTVLSWAEDPKSKTRWPIEWVVEYGKGRCYNSTFGHVWRNEADPVDMRCAGFQTVMVRALQWLAHQPITYPVPKDFPSETNTVLRSLSED